MSDRREHHGMSRAAELLAGLGTTRELATALGKSAGTIGDYRTGRRRPAPDVMSAIEARWPQVPVELWDAPPRGQHGAQPAPSTRAEPPRSQVTPDDDAADAGDDASAGVTATELHEMILGDLARLRGADGAVLEIGKRSEVIRRLVAAQTALSKTSSQSALTLEQIFASAAGEELIASLADALSQIPTTRWALEHAARVLASGEADATARDLLRRQVGACYGGELARRARELGVLDPFLARPDVMSAIETIVIAIGCQPCRDSVVTALRSLGATPKGGATRKRGAVTPSFVPEE